jgi:hypothetical protein
MSFPVASAGNRMSATRRSRVDPSGLLLACLMADFVAGRDRTHVIFPPPPEKS